ncbi:MAG: glycosyl transferase group 1 [Parcubacteria group bacterium Gr01-1014_46]|nr:MAG: glycosyl transferase group 1 [Parcubacteria group bacterium Gr01-1014_46]
MKVLSIGTDRKLFDEKSAVFTRQNEYAKKMDELHVLVFTLKKEGCVYKKEGNLFIYPTNSISQWFYVLDAYFLGRKIIKTNSFSKNSVISTQDAFQTGFVGAVFAWYFSLPLQVQVHTDFLSPYFKGFFNSIRKIISWFVLKNASQIRVVSEPIKTSIESKYPKLKPIIKILPVFVDVERIENLVTNKEQLTPSSLPFKNNIFMYSRLTKEKRFDIALNVIKKVTNTYPDSGLVIFGVGPEENNIKKMAKELGIDNRVVFKGWMDNIDILALFYRQSDIFLLTSEYEGYGMTLIEAGASGCPIVTTNVGIAQTGLFKDGFNSYVCPVGDTDCLGERLKDLITNEEKRKSFSDNMRDSIKEVVISKEDYVDRYIGLLEELTKNA